MVLWHCIFLELEKYFLADVFPEDRQRRLRLWNLQYLLAMGSIAQDSDDEPFVQVAADQNHEPAMISQQAVPQLLDALIVSISYQ